MTDARTLMRALGLKVTSKGPNGRYPCAEPGPAPGYRYWACVFEDGYRFGVQTNPKRELDARGLVAFRNAGFGIMPKQTEAFMVLTSPLNDAVDEARAVMARIRSTLAEVGG